MKSSNRNRTDITKLPPNIPSIGDRVKLRGRTAIGKLEFFNERKWCQVIWDEPYAGPTLVHLNELEKI